MGDAHAAGMFALWSDPDVCRYSGPLVDADGRPIRSPVAAVADSDRIIAFWTTACREGRGCRWALTLRSSGAFVGSAGFNSLGPCSEYAYHLLPAFWGGGLMAEATAVLFAWVASAHACREVEAFVDPANVRSVAFAERQGFARAGVAADGTIRYVSALSV